MASILKYWKESSSLIIASKKFSSPLIMQKALENQSFLSKNKQQNKSAVNVLNANEDNTEFLRVLVLKRFSNNAFMPGSFVFPGGIVNISDFSEEWLDILRIKPENNLFSKAVKGSSIFSRERNVKLPGEIGLRITAIRETFEESGILLARPASELSQLEYFGSEKHHPICSTSCILSEEKNLIWREKIISDPSQFLLMCKDLEVVPDIWSLYEWSNWLTPLLKGPRFDTAFFISCVEEAPPVYDSNETEDGLWLSPSGVLKACANGIIALAPPQIYELSRLVHYTNIEDLLALSWKNSFYRAEQWMPVIYQCQDSLIFALPGDDMYPDNPDYTGEFMESPINRTENLQELQTLYPNHNRIAIHNSKQASLFCNLNSIPGYVMPLEFNTIKKNMPF